MALRCTFYGTSSALPSVNRGFSCIGLSDDKNLAGLYGSDGLRRWLDPKSVEIRSKGRKYFDRH